ncbi:MAG: hypothetical protein RR922_06590 [Clostridia bacterium]
MRKNRKLNFKSMFKHTKVSTLSKLILILTLLFVTFCIFPTVKKQIIQEEDVKKMSENVSRNDQNIEHLKELLKEKISFSKNYVNTISFANDIVLMKISGNNIEIFDDTNYSNTVTEYFSKKQLVLSEDYTAVISIPLLALDYGVNDKTGNVSITYDKDKIQLLAVDILKSSFSEDNIFYRNYDKEDLVAMQRNSLSNIKDSVLNKQNLNLAEQTIINYIFADAIMHNINEIELNGTNVDLSSEKQKQTFIQNLELN